MYKILIDYSETKEIKDHWYGNFNKVKLPKLPNSDKNFYNIFSLLVEKLPVNFDLNLERIYLPHYFESDFIMEDIFFSFDNDKVMLLNDIDSNVLNVYDDFVDHQPKAITFRKLQEYENPSSADFDEDRLQSPYHQLGGYPFFVQPDGHLLQCIKCLKEMNFLLQFGSDSNINAEFDDGGVAYYWFCPDCSIIGCRVESF